MANLPMRFRMMHQYGAVVVARVDELREAMHGGAHGSHIARVDDAVRPTQLNGSATDQTATSKRTPCEP